MLKKYLLWLVLPVLLLSLTGCATVRKQKDLEIQGLRNQIQALEVQLQEKDQEIMSLKENLPKTQRQTSTKKEAAAKKVIGEVKSRPTPKQIQIALRNAGYNPGAIDGHLGTQTRQAIRAFQGANNLSADGKVGKKTWNLLRDYLYKKVK